MLDTVLARRKVLLTAFALGLAQRVAAVRAAIPRYVFSRSWGSAGTANGRFDGPRGIAVFQDRVYVADSYNNRIQMFTLAGTFSRKWGTFGTGNGQLNRPRGVAVDSRGLVYVADTLNHRIQVFTITGGFVRRFGSQGTALERVMDFARQR